MPVVVMSANGTLLEANNAYCKAFSLGRSKVLGTAVDDRAGKEMREATRREFAKLSPANPTITAPAMLQTLYGQERRRIWEITGLFDEAGRLEAVMTVFWDVTEEYFYNETLEELIRITNDRSLDTEETVEGILAIGHAYFGMTAGVISRYNGEGVRAEFQVRPDFSELGRSVPLELSYTSITHSRGTIVAIPEIDKTQHADSAFFKHLNLKNFLSAEIHVDGELYGALSFASPEARSHPFSNEDIQLIRILAQSLSYALLRRRKIAELKASEKKYRFIYQNSPIMMHTIGPDLKITDVNKMWFDTLDLAREDVIGTHLTTYFTEASKKAVYDAASGRTKLPLVAAPRTMVRADGTVVEVEASTLTDPNDGGPVSILSVLNNVTDRNRAQRSLARLNEGLRRTNEGLKRFNAIAAHNLQEPFRKIRLFTDVLDETLDSEGNPQLREPLTIIRRSSDRLSKLVNDLQTYTRETQRGFQRMPVDLNRLLENVLETLDPDPAADIAIATLPQVTGDPASLNKLFRNLLANALADEREGRPCEVRVLAQILGDGTARLTIRDNGSGLSPARAEKIFEAFAHPRHRPTKSFAVTFPTRACLHK
ncbi:MAG: PAS domain S-box protein [Breoghania sp.]|nr:PAS domain S-box protein [Breoghania sp.]